MKKLSIFILIACMIACSKTDVIDSRPQSGPIYNSSTLDTITLANGKKAIVQTRVVYDTILIETRPTVLIGSSSSTEPIWPTFKTVFADYDVIQKGVGGNTFGSMSFRVRRDVTAYHPKQVLLQGDENSWYEVIDRGVKLTKGDYVYRAKLCIDSILLQNKGVDLVVFETKKTPYLASIWDRIQEGNDAVEALLATKPNCRFMKQNDLLVESDYKSDRKHLLPASNKKIEERLKQYMIK